MKYKNFIIVLTIAFSFAFSNSYAHCDGIDGPVVKAAKKSIEENNINIVLAWIKPEYENEVKNAFTKTMSIRNQNKETAEIADYYFYETVVRLHRLGEGETYTGLKPSGKNISEGIVQADLSIEKNDLQSIVTLMIENVKESLESKFHTLIQRSNFNPTDVESGREYVEAYVNYIHYAEQVFEFSKNHSEHHSH